MVNISRLFQMPTLIKPVTTMILIAMIILYGVSWWKPSPYFWFVVILQLILSVILVCAYVFEVPGNVIPMTPWILGEVGYSGLFVLFHLINLIINIVWLFRFSILFGFTGLCSLAIIALNAFNGMMMFKIWRDMGSNASTAQRPAGGIQPGNPGQMHPGFGTTPVTVGGAYPGAGSPPPPPTHVVPQYPNPQSPPQFSTQSPQTAYGAQPPAYPKD